LGATTVAFWVRVARHKSNISERAVAVILPFLREASFDANTTRRMGEAFDIACGHLQTAGWDGEEVRTAIAKCIVSHAQYGEQVSSRLAASALSAIGFDAISAANGENAA
jgi:hypothetical protein